MGSAFWNTKSALDGVVENMNEQQRTGFDQAFRNKQFGFEKQRYDDSEDARKGGAIADAQLKGGKVYLTPTVNAKGNVAGFQENAEWMNRDIPILRRRAPEFMPGAPKPSSSVAAVFQPSAPAPAPAAPAPTTDIQHADPMKDPLAWASAAGKFRGKNVSLDEARRAIAEGRQPDEPAPLLVDPKKQVMDSNPGQAPTPEKRYSENTAANGDKVRLPEGVSEYAYDPNAPKIQNPDGTVTPTGARTKINMEGATVEGEMNPPPAAPPAAPAPAQIPPAAPDEPFRPSPFLLADIRENATAVGHRETDPVVAFDSLPSSLRRQIGVEDDKGQVAPGGVPRSILQEMMRGATKLSAAASKAKDLGLGENAAALGELVQSGQLTASQAISQLRASGEGVGKTELKYLNDMSKSYRSQENQTLNREAYGGRFDRSMQQRQIQFAEQVSNRNEDEKRRYGETIDKAGFKDVLPAMQTIDRVTGILSGKNVSLEKLPGQGTNAIRNLVPIFGDSAGNLAAKRYGGGKVYQALQTLVNMDTKRLSGTAVTKAEQGRLLIQNGMALGGDERDVARGVQLMKEAYSEYYKSIRAAAPASARRAYESEGGMSDFDSQFKGRSEPTRAEARAQRDAAASTRSQGKAPAKADAAAPAGWADQNSKGISLMRQYSAMIQQQMAEGGKGAQWASQQINTRRAALDKLLKDKFGRGFEDGR